MISKGSKLKNVGGVFNRLSGRLSALFNSFKRFWNRNCVVCFLNIRNKPTNGKSESRRKQAQILLKDFVAASRPLTATVLAWIVTVKPVTTFCTSWKSLIVCKTPCTAWIALVAICDISWSFCAVLPTFPSSCVKPSIEEEKRSRISDMLERLSWRSPLELVLRFFLENSLRLLCFFSF